MPSSWYALRHQLPLTPHLSKNARLQTRAADYHQRHRVDQRMVPVEDIALAAVLAVAVYQVRNEFAAHDSAL